MPARLRAGGGRTGGQAHPLPTHRQADSPRSRRPDRSGARRRPGLLPRVRQRRLLLMSAPTRSRRDVLARRIRLLVAATITYNVVEAVIALSEGAGVLVGAVRLRPRLGDRGVVGGGRRMAVLRQGPRDAGEGRAA